MEKLRAYLNSLSQSEQSDFASKCKTTIGYLRKGLSVGQLFGESLCINIERESKKKVTCEDLRSDVDWAYLRGSKKAA